MVEFFRGSAISKKEILDRVTLVNEQIITHYLDEGIPVVLVAGHQGNWEWAVHRLALSENLCDIVYQKLSSTLFNNFTFWVRSRFGSNVLMEKRESVILARDRKDIPRAICLAADQSPSKPESAYWTNFLTQPTGFFTGMERFAREYQYPVIFVELIRKICLHRKINIINSSNINLCIDARKTYFNHIFKPRLDYITNYVLDERQLNFLTSPVAYTDGNINYTIPSKPINKKLYEEVKTKADEIKVCTSKKNISVWVENIKIYQEKKKHY
jgi:hypothetical protein